MLGSCKQRQIFLKERQVTIFCVNGQSIAKKVSLHNFHSVFQFLKRFQANI